jgi:Raf kinase inhibitor-like YbhB/YbcL family protein
LPNRLISRSPPGRGEVPGIILTSSAFQDGRSIPKLFTGRGRNISPPLAWQNPPAGTMSFALLMDDPDAPGGTFNHWVLFDLPASTLALGAGISRLAALPNGALPGTNENENIGYDGPKPPAGRKHTYVFQVFALDTQLNLGAGATKTQLLIAVAGHVLAEAQLRGTFKR